MKKLIIYYLSGTGNTFRVARWMCDAAAQKNFNATPIAVEHANPHAELAAQVDIIGIGMPTHGFTLPWKMLKFLLRLPRGKGIQAFAFATRAGAKYGPIPGYPPGIAGSSIFIAAIVLAFKGYRVRGIMSVNMPSNWMSLHSGLRADIVQTIIGKARPGAMAFIEKITGGETVFFTGNVLYELIWALALSWISAGYLFIGRFSLAKLFFANTKCNGCGLCAKNCPTRSITMIGRKNPRPYWSLTCESCMRCMGFCPNKAIEAGHSWAAVLYYLTMEIPAAAIVMKHLVDRWRWILQLNRPAGFLLFLCYYFTVLWAVYWLFWLLVRIPLGNYLFTWTTLTRWYRRYHEPETKLNDFQTSSMEDPDNASS